MNKWVKTNIPGFMKDPKTNVLHNVTPGVERIAQEQRAQWKRQRNLENRIDELEEKLSRLLRDK